MTPFTHQHSPSANNVPNSSSGSIFSSYHTSQVPLKTSRSRHTTRKLIFDKQIGFILQEQWDDFGKLTIDSTSVKANSCWPTDGKILTGLLRRANRLGQKLHVFGLEDFRKGWVGRWLQEMDKLEFQICLASGKPKSKGKLNKHCRRLLKRGRKAADSLTGELSHLEEACRWIHCLPLAGSF